MRRAEPADLEGAATLERMAAAPRYNRRMYERLAPRVGRRGVVMGRAERGGLGGAATLERMAAAPRYNRWMYERLRPWVGRRVLEIGAGIGNMSAFLIDRDRVVLTDTEPYYLDRLRARYRDLPHVTVAELRLPAT